MTYRGAVLYFILGTLLLCHGLWAQSESLVCQDVTIASPWSEEIPICWPTADNVVYSIWPEGTEVGGYVADGNFFRQLALVFNPRSGNVCAPGQSCYYAKFLSNVHSIQGMGGDWLVDESSQDIIKLMGCFNTNDMTGDGRFVYEYLIDVADTGLQQRYVGADVTELEPLATIVPYDINNDNDNIDGSGLIVGGADELSEFRMLANTLADTSFLKPMVRSCANSYLPYLTQDEQLYLLTLSDEQIAKKKSSTSQASTAPQLVVDGDIDNENGCSHLYDYRNELWNGMGSLLERMDDYKTKLDAIAASNDLDIQRFSAAPAFVVYQSAFKCLNGMLQVLHERNGVFDDVDDDKNFFGWYGTHNDWWTAVGASNASEVNQCHQFIDLYTDSSGAITQITKGDAVKIFNKNIAYNKRVTTDPTPGIMRAMRQVLFHLEKLLAAQVKVQAVKGGNTFLYDSASSTYKSTIYDLDLPFPQMRYLTEDARAEDSTCTYKPLTEELTANNMQDTYELLQRDLIAKYIDFENGAPFIGFDTTAVPLADMAVDNAGQDKVIPVDNQFLYVQNGKLNRYAEFCLSGAPNASRILRGLPNDPDTNVNDKRSYFPPKQYKMYQKVQQEVLDQMRVEYESYQKAVMAVNLRRAIQVYQAKLQLLKTMQLTRSKSGSCYYSLTEHYALAAKFRNSTDYASLVDIFNLTFSGSGDSITPDQGVLAYQAFLDRQINNQGSRVLDVIRDLAFMKYVELYTMNEWIKLLEVQNMYLASEKVAAMKDPLDSLKFMVKDSYTDPVAKYYQAAPTSAGILQGEGGPALGGEPELSEEEQALTAGTPEQSGNADTCVTNL